MQDSRPTIFEYDSIPGFISDMLAWKKKSEDSFSIRKLTKNMTGCSPSLVTQVAKGNRSLTKDRVKPFSKLLSLTKEEQEYLEKWALVYKHTNQSALNDEDRKIREQNNFLNDWLNVYVKDSIRLKSFVPDATKLAKVLGHIASPSRVEKAIKFLLREGYWRKDLEGNIIKNDELTKSTNNISDRRIKQFHKAAIDIARKGLDAYSVNRRLAKAMILPVNKENETELKSIIEEFQTRLEDFSTKYKEDDETLYQLITHLTPIGGDNYEVH